MKLVMIEWDDPGLSAAHWEDREPFTEKPVPCISCGILLHEDDESYHLVLNLNHSFYAQGITIPKGIVKRVRYLKCTGNKC